MLVTVARLRPGVPSNLNAFCVADYGKGTSPKLWGFPDFKRNTLKEYFYEKSYRTRKLTKRHDTYSAGYYNHFYGEQQDSQEDVRIANTNNYFHDFSIISVYHPIVDDRCNRLFTLDTGVLSYGLTVTYNVKNPSITVYELPSNGCTSRKFPVIRRVDIPNHLWQFPVGFVHIALDYQSRGSCDDLFLYITNCFDNSIIVFDYLRGDFWSFTDSSMKPIAAQASMVFGKSFNYEFNFGIMNVALGWPIDKAGNRKAYYAAGASLGEYAVSTKLLKNSKKAQNKYSEDDFHFIGYRGCDSQIDRQVFDHSTGVMFFGEMQSNKIRCWNTKLPLNPDTIGVVMESDALQYISEIFVDSEGYLWCHSCQLPIVYLSDSPLNTKKINSRTFRMKVLDVIKGTVCDVSNYKLEGDFYLEDE
ncbi:L-dopachrome tautomerase yellow-f2-like [Phlebotomus papatasi]|uniref:L-dopachrome tautomerase yellow-f2-like n=1 Tax=Phlebotomus papatasi TaxID=29031 RepID=UPI0024835380|nr:L-dopachrome tautomerase yellow-f2-like [Phlebotomus papatasi]